MPVAIARTITCLSPATNESSLIFPAISPPNSASSNAVCMNTLLDSSGVSMGLIIDAPFADISLIGANIIVEMMIIMKRNITTEK